MHTLKLFKIIKYLFNSLKWLDHVLGYHLIHKVILPYPFFFGTIPTNREFVIPGYQNIAFDNYILILCSSNITYDSSFITFDSFILILCSSNITYDSFFVTFGGPLFFFSHLIVSSLHYAIPTLHVTVLLSHSVVLLFFSHIWRFHLHIVQFQHYMWLFFC